MTLKEMSELDEWLKDNLPNMPSNGHPTRDYALLMLVLERCNQHINTFKHREVIGISTICGDPLISYNDFDIAEWEKTLPLAICKFAKQLFSK